MWGFICPIKLLNWMFYLKLNFIFSFRVPQKPTQLPLIEHNRDICHWISLIHSLVPTCSAVLLTTCLGPPSLRRRRLCRKWSWRQPLPRMMIGWLSTFKVHHTQLQQTNTSAVLYVNNVLHAVIHIEQFEHLCFPFSLMLYYPTFKSCKHLLLLFLLGCMLHKAAPFGI